MFLLRSPTSSGPCVTTLSGHVVSPQTYHCRLHQLISLQKGQEQSVILHDERPALVARLMLWIYYGEYRVYGNHTGEGLCLNDLMSSTLTTAPQVTNSTEQPIALTMAETVDPALSGFAIASDPQPGGQAQPQTTSQPPIPPSNAPRQPGHLRKVEIDIHWSMYMIADKYGCPELRRYCVKQMFMVTRLEHGAAGIWHIVQYAKSASMPVQDVQEEIISFFMLHFRYFGEDPRFKDLVKTTPELAWALVSAYSRHGLLYPGRTA